MRRRLGLSVLGATIVASGCDLFTGPGDRSLWVSLAAHAWFTCGISPGGSAYCWGGTSGGSRAASADSAIAHSTVPLRVKGGQTFTSISVGETVVCGLDPDGRALCWGANRTGAVGDSTLEPRSNPTSVAGAQRWVQIDAGMSHVCGVSVEQKAYCWGNNFRGALGSGVSGGVGAWPFEVVDLPAVAVVSAGNGTSCALSVAGKAYCWGVNDNGILGDGQHPDSSVDSSKPVSVVGDIIFSSLSAGGHHVCGIAVDRQAYCWGWNAYGQLGDGTTDDASRPSLVARGVAWVQLSAGHFHTCGVSSLGATYCWGRNDEGQFGTGLTGRANAPQLIAPPRTYTAVIAGGLHTCAVTPRGVAECWGRGNSGQLGDGRGLNSLRPVQVAAVRD